MFDQLTGPAVGRLEALGVTGQRVAVGQPTPDQGLHNVGAMLGHLHCGGFVTDFGDLKPFAAYLRAPGADVGLRSAGPALVAHLAHWFVDNLEPKICGRLVSVRIASGTTTGLWERGGAA